MLEAALRNVHRDCLSQQNVVEINMDQIEEFSDRHRQLTCELEQLFYRMEHHHDGARMKADIATLSTLVAQLHCEVTERVMSFKFGPDNPYIHLP